MQTVAADAHTVNFTNEFLFWKRLRQHLPECESCRKHLGRLQMIINKGVGPRQKAHTHNVDVLQPTTTTTTTTAATQLAKLGSEDYYHE